MSAAFALQPSGQKPQLAIRALSAERNADYEALGCGASLLAIRASGVRFHSGIS
jgi:hypothetical protein